MTKESGSIGLVTELTQHLGGIFRHMLPGVLVLGGTWLAYPKWFPQYPVLTWQSLIVLAVISIAVGNTWFALNRYGLHQFIDYILYLIRSNGPARERSWFAYLDDLGKYTYRSLHTDDSSARARQHVAFRASTVLLALTVGELLLTFIFFHDADSIFNGQWKKMAMGSVFAIAVGIWQMVIARRIDYYVVNPPCE